MFLFFLSCSSRPSSFSPPQLEFQGSCERENESTSLSLFLPSSSSLSSSSNSIFVDAQVPFEINTEGYIKDMLVATNCILSGGGSIKPFADCVGCMQEDAQQCVNEMRFNTSGTVPDGCDFYSLTADGRPGCCADFLYQTRPDTIFKETSA